MVMPTTLVIEKLDAIREDGKLILRAVEEIGTVVWKDDGTYAVYAPDEAARSFITAQIEKVLKAGVHSHWGKTYPDESHILYGRQLNPADRSYAQWLARQLFGPEDTFEGKKVVALTARDSSEARQQLENANRGVEFRRRADILKAGEGTIVQWLQDNGYTTNWEARSPETTDIGAEAVEAHVLVQIRSAVVPDMPSALSSDEERSLKARATAINYQAWEAKVQLDAKLQPVGQIMWRQLV